MRAVIVIPARFASTRLPGKPLADIHGKPMIQHVVERCALVPEVAAVVVATDDERVAAAVLAFGGQVVMTSPDHVSGTDRLVQVMQHLDADIFLNVQGDEPLVRPEDLAGLLDVMRLDRTVAVGTLCHAVDAREALNPNCVKVVRDDAGFALYFSRAPIPYPREQASATYLKHVGVYAYRRDVLATYSQLARPMIESAESLEQLRLMAAGIRIRLVEVEPTGPGVDTPECLERVRAIMAGLSVASQPGLADIRLVITDVDGVLTDGSIFYDASGECLKRFHVRDGLGIRMLEENGVRVAVLSGRDSPTLRKRVADLGISFFKLGVKDKALACRELMMSAGVESFQTACVGDDTIDLPAFHACGLSFSVADAPEYVQRQSSRVLSKKGGEGAFRELSDQILAAQGKGHVFGSADGFLATMNKVVQ